LNIKNKLKNTFIFYQKKKKKRRRRIKISIIFSSLRYIPPPWRSRHAAPNSIMEGIVYFTLKASSLLSVKWVFTV
jgi:predicted metal-dependent hydrolase